jgi:hypothetical protein
MTPKGLRKCRAVDGEENQKQVSRRRPRALGNHCRDSHIPAAPATTAMGKWKSKNRIPTFPQRLPCHHQNQKRKEINPSPKPCPSGSSQDWNVLVDQQINYRSMDQPVPKTGPGPGVPYFVRNQLRAVLTGGGFRPSAAVAEFWRRHSEQYRGWANLLQNFDPAVRDVKPRIPH